MRALAFSWAHWFLLGFVTISSLDGALTSNNSRSIAEHSTKFTDPNYYVENTSRRKKMTDFMEVVIGALGVVSGIFAAIVALRQLGVFKPHLAHKPKHR